MEKKGFFIPISNFLQNELRIIDVYSYLKTLL